MNYNDMMQCKKNTNKMEKDEIFRMNPMQHSTPINEQQQMIHPFYPPGQDGSTPLRGMPMMNNQMPAMFDPHLAFGLDPNWSQMMGQFLGSLDQIPNWQSLTGSPNTSNDSGISSCSTDPLSSPKEDPRVIRRVQGRLTLNSNPRQYDITADEIKRRINTPERMNSSTLAALTRRAKTKDGGAQMRKELEDFGIVPCQARNKAGSAQHTCFSALLEEEALQMANELKKIADEHFPKDEMAHILIANACQTNEMTEIQREAFYTMNFLKRLLCLSMTFKPSVGKFKGDTPKNQFDEKMANFSALTHGFGVGNSRTWMEQFTQIAQIVSHTLQQ